MIPELPEVCRQPDGAMRPTFCNIPEWAQWFVYPAGLLAILIFASGVWCHRRVWMAGQPDAPSRNLGNWRARTGLFIRHVLGQRATLRRPFPGVFHSGIFWGFVLLLIGTVLATVDWDVWHIILDRQFLKGAFYQGYELVLDTAGFLFIVALLLAMWRRYIVAPHHVLGAWDFVIWSLLFINVTGFLVEGLRLAMAPVPWGRYSWLGQGIANTLYLLPADVVRNTVPGIHLGVWLLHAAASLLFVAAIPYTNAVHMITTAANAVLASLEPTAPGAALQPIDIESAEFFGVGRLGEFNWKQRLGVDSCTRCGRCEMVCPAYMSGTPLNPKEIIVGLSGALRDELDRPPAPDDEGELIVGDERPVNPSALWACTTCVACVEACPAYIEIVDDIVDMRRYLTLTEGSVPGTSGPALRNMGTSGNPWGYAQEERLNWAAGLDVPRAEPGEHYEVLYWVGCSASYDQRNQRIARAVVRLLHEAGVGFAVLAQERCTAESARRMGDEYLFQTVTEVNVNNLNSVSFDRIVCHCPHCFNTLKNEYPQFGGHYEVVHHTQLFRELIRRDRLRVGDGVKQRVAFHDSCYLGRYNGEFDAPREALLSAGQDLIEPARNREDGLCCGGGGGRMWFEHEGQARAVEVIRMEEVLATAPDIVGVACPFCLTMLESAAASMGAEGVQVRDVAEVLAGALGQPPAAG